MSLFGTEGFNATSTSKIAELAGVSEGLIFRHFNNKEGLLAAVMEQGELQLKQLIELQLSSDQPEELLRRAILSITEMSDEAKEFWRLQFRLKWETNRNNPAKENLLKLKLEQSFRKLNYAHPDMEAQSLQLLLESMFSCILLEDSSRIEELQSYLLMKYKLS